MPSKLMHDCVSTESQLWTERWKTTLYEYNRTFDDFWNFIFSEKEPDKANVMNDSYVKALVDLQAQDIEPLLRILENNESNKKFENVIEFLAAGRRDTLFFSLSSATDEQLSKKHQLLDSILKKADQTRRGLELWLSKPDEHYSITSSQVNIVMADFTDAEKELVDEIVDYSGYHIRMFCHFLLDGPCVEDETTINSVLQHREVTNLIAGILHNTIEYDDEEDDEEDIVDRIVRIIRSTDNGYKTLKLKTIEMRDSICKILKND